IQAGPSKRDGLPFRRRGPGDIGGILLVPFELDKPQLERRGSVKDRKVATTIEREPNPVTLLVTRSVPDCIDRRRFGCCQTIRRSGRTRLAADVGTRVKVTGSGIVN